jgi:hypothetical protein
LKQKKLQKDEILGAFAPKITSFYTTNPSWPDSIYALWNKTSLMKDKGQTSNEIFETRIIKNDDMYFQSIKLLWKLVNTESIQPKNFIFYFEKEMKAFEIEGILKI